MKEKELTELFINLTAELLDLARKTCSNDINNNCQYILSKIASSNDINFIKQQKKDWKINNQKKPKHLDQIIDQLNEFYPDIYDINLQIFKANKDSTIIDIRYFLKSELDIEVYEKIKNNEPMLHCKIPAPYYSTFSDMKFDINWQSGGFRHEWKMFWWKRKKYRKTLGNNAYKT